MEQLTEAEPVAQALRSTFVTVIARLFIIGARFCTFIVMNQIEVLRRAKETGFWAALAVYRATSRASGATLPLYPQQVTTRHVQIGQRRRHEQAVRILRQSLSHKAVSPNSRGGKSLFACGLALGR